MDSIQKINIYYGWWMEALAEEKYEHADRVKKRFLDPEIKRCIEEYLVSEESDKLIEKAKNIIEDKGLPDIKKLVKGPPSIFIGKKIVDVENIEQKAEQLIKYYDDKIWILRNNEEFDYISNIAYVRRMLIDAYTEFLLEKGVVGGKRSELCSSLIKAYNHSLDTIKRHNELYDSGHQ